MKRAVFVLLALLILPSALAQLPWSVTDLRCGNGKLDQFELCEKDVDESRCDALADHLNIAMACYDDHCTCVPRVNPTYCGNNRRDFNEMCDGTSEEDMCPALGGIMGNISLKCDKDTCGCSIEGVGTDYNPLIVETLINDSKKTAVCGDKKVERDEDCDPPNTLCALSGKSTGVCTDKCQCVRPDQLGEEETPEVEENTTLPEINNTVPEIVDEPEKTDETGFFGKLWLWFASLFS